jgi:hypothetical protein
MLYPLSVRHSSPPVKTGKRGDLEKEFKPQ